MTQYTLKNLTEEYVLVLDSLIETAEVQAAWSTDSQ